MGEEKTVLLVEDNQKLNEINRRALEMDGYKVLTAVSVEEARAWLRTAAPDVILLDVMLPDGDGIEFCGEIRRLTDAHILFLTSRAAPGDRVSGLETGGDDYITKPYQLKELLARVHAAIRRREIGGAGQGKTVVKGPLTLEPLSMQAFLSGRNLLLTPKEFSLLLLFVQNEGRPLTGSHLFEMVWKQPDNGDVRAVKNHLSSLRKKLEGSGYTISAARGSGYLFERV